jgi:HlyD family secretion protein
MPERVRSSADSLVRHAWWGLASVVVLAGGLILWAATTEIAGAVVAEGQVAVDGGSKQVQHSEGGIVKEILADNEDLVSAGDLLIRLDGTTVAANLAVIVSQLEEAFARRARLVAESQGAELLIRPAELAGWSKSLNLDRLFSEQETLRATRAAAKQNLVARLEEQRVQIGGQIEGLEAQLAASVQELAIISAEERDVGLLYQQGLVQIGRLNTMKRDQARLEGEKGRIIAEIAAARAAIAEREVQQAQTEDDFQAEVLEELQAAGQQIAELLQQKIAAEDRLLRLEIRAPQSGIVHESGVQTVGGVVAAGQTLMLIVPQSNELIVIARVSPLDVDKLTVNQAVVLQLSSLEARTTPELDATIEAISPDLSQDPVTGASYYSVKIAVSNSEMGRLPAGTRLVPGMPAVAFIQTGDRTALSYLVQPFTEQLQLAFRED